VRTSFLDLIKNPGIKLRKVNADEKPAAKPAPKGASSGNHMDELMMRIRQRGQAMAGKDIQERRALLELPAKKVEEPTPVQAGDIVTGDNGLTFAIKEDSGAGSGSGSSPSSDWDT
jgi:hypothetical protein